MADNQLKRYPRGQMKMAGDLVQVTNASFKKTNNAKLMHTLRKSPSGVVLGHNEATFSFEAIVDEDGQERDWDNIQGKGLFKTFQFIRPATDAAVVIGVVADLETSMASDGAVTLRGNGVGMFVD